MDDEKFKIELLGKLDRIQTLLSYLCGAAKAAEERTNAESAGLKHVGTEPGNTEAVAGRSLIQDEMQDDYNEAMQKWKTGKT